MSKRHLFLTGLIILLFAVAYRYDRFIVPIDQLEEYADVLEDYLHKKEGTAEEFLSDKSLLKSLSTNTLKNTLQEQIGKQVFCYIYLKDSLIFWSSNQVVPNEQALNRAPKSSLVELADGFYELRKNQLIVDRDTFNLVTLIPIKRDHPLSTEYLSEKFWTTPPLPSSLQISQFPSGDSILITTKEGSPIFYLTADLPLRNKTHQIYTLLLYLLAFIALAILVNEFSNYLVKRLNPLVGAGFLFLTVMGIRTLSVGLDFTSRFPNLEIFSNTFSTSVMDTSLGDLLINSILMLWMMVFFHKEFKIPSLVKVKGRMRWVLTTACYFCIVLGLLFITLIIKNLVINSAINFDFNNVLNMDSDSLLAIIAIILLIVSLFLFTHRMVLTVAEVNLSGNSRLATSILAVFLAIPLMIFADLSLSTLQFILISIVYVSLFDIFIDSQRPGLTWLVIWLFLFSAYISILLYKYNLDKDRNRRLDFAQLLTDIRDVLAEEEINLLHISLLNNPELEGNFSQLTKMEIGDIIEQYFVPSNYLFHNYQYELIFPTDTNFPGFEKNLEETEIGEYNNIYYWPEENNPLDYVLQIDLNKENTFYIGFTYKKRETSRVYAELLLDTKYRGLELLNQYDYAVFQDEQLISRNGNPPLSLISDPPPLQLGEWEERLNSARSDLIYRSENNTVVFIGKKLGGYFKPLSLFSYLFVLLAITTIILSTLNHLINAIPISTRYTFLGRPSLTNRIQLSVIALILGSFVIIGLVTVTFFRTSSIEYHEDLLTNKISAVLQDVEHETELLSVDENGRVDFERIIHSISNIHNMDINIFQTNGALKITSASYVFERGIIAPVMDAKAFLALHHQEENLFIQEENLGDLTYKAAYVPLRSPTTNQIINYLGLPYYSKARNLRTDLLDFMGTLLNVYVFLLLCAAAIAIAVANSITQPIAQIGEKLRRFKLGSNEPLDWKSNDELGELISEYNQMIQKLEESTIQLKQSEREGAWREMAKQVAHEIKNPLTPMKLSIQYLMHAQKSNEKDLAPLLSRVSKTLIEQIDGLSRIASEFSNFAKMPKAQNSNLTLNDLVESVFDLFKEHQSESLHLSLTLPEDNLLIYADKDHLIRVLNNLIKNAIQAIPENRKGEIEVALYPMNGMAVIRITDNGSGIDEKMRDQVFFPNFTTKTSGTGLGLAITKSIIESIDGKIYFQTKTGTGTSFFIELPIQEDDQSVSSEIKEA